MGSPIYKKRKMMNSVELKDLICKHLDDKKAEDMVVIDLRDRPSITDFFVIASGTSGRHVASMAELLSIELKTHGIYSKIEGLESCDWVLLDAGDVVVHLFKPEIRTFYDLEKMWSVRESQPSTLVL
jgi:ribosome-associated protein